jgi:hypothetical protein
MSSLEQIALSLAESQALVKHGIRLDTALCWFHYGHTEHWGLLTREQALTYARMNTDHDVPAPVLSELLDVLEPSQSSAEKMVALAHALIALHDEAKS